MKTFNIKQTAAMIELSEFRTRNLLKSGQIKGIKENIPGSDVIRWNVTEEAINEYLANKKNKNSKQYIVSLTSEQLQLLQQFSEQQELNLEFKPRFMKTTETDSETEE